MILKFPIVLALSSVLLLGCTENEKQKMIDIIDIVKEIMMSNEEKEAKRREEEYQKKKEEMEYLHSVRYDNLIQGAEPEIRRIIAENLNKKKIPYSKIIIYDGYIHSPSNAKSPNEYDYIYKVNFYADIVRDEVFTINTRTLTGYVDFTFLLNNEDNYSIGGYSYEQINNTNDFSDITKIGVRTLFDKLTEDNEQN